MNTKLIQWIDSHATAEPTVDNGDGTLTVASLMCGNGQMSSIERSVIPGTFKAARDWLGY